MHKKKSLGQNFLHSPHYLGLIADAVNIVPENTVLEIGPGEGTLTQELLARGARVIAVEKDRRLIAPLKEKFSGKNAEVVEGDALTFDTARFAGAPYKVVGNIPYYITGALFKKFLSAEHQPETLVFLVQKEVAQRITGHPSTSSGSPKESILSLSVKVYGVPRCIKTVPRGAFTPAPKVDSAIVAVEHIARKNFASAAHEKKFFEVLRAGFSSKRKFLRRNLEPVLGNTVELFEKADIPQNARAEDVPLDAWLALAR